MIDPFLLAHEVAPLCFEIGGILSPVSIRDQMIRGRWIVDRAMEAGLVLPGGNLLIIGAGAAGVTAAIEGASRGILVTLIDTAPAAFTRQAGCSSRWVDPTQYDWPVDHWAKSVFPWTRPAMPLSWRAGRANMLAIAWGLALRTAIARYGTLLNVSFGTGLVGSPTVSGTTPAQLNVVFTSGISGYFDIAVSTVGFGTERTTSGTFSSYRFWDTDPLEQANYGLPSTPSPSILISGGGDGALQDFIRVSTTAPSARHIYDALSLSPNVLNALESAIQSAEDQAQRAYLWGTPGSATVPARDHTIHERLHQAFVGQVDVLANDPVVWPGVVAALNKVVRPAGGATVSLVYPCTHFDRCYALNRFLVLLLARYFEKPRKQTVLYPSTKVTAVSGSMHTCANNPSFCHGQDHDVSFASSACPGFTPLTASSSAARHQIVLLRHGIIPPTSVYGPAAVAIQFPRQMIPYYSPW